MKKLIFKNTKYLFKAKRRLDKIECEVVYLTTQEEQSLPGGMSPCGMALLMDDVHVEEAKKILLYWDIEIYEII